MAISFFVRITAASCAIAVVASCAPISSGSHGCGDPCAPSESSSGLTGEGCYDRYGHPDSAPHPAYDAARSDADPPHQPSCAYVFEQAWRGDSCIADEYPRNAPGQACDVALDCASACCVAAADGFDAVPAAPGAGDGGARPDTSADEDANTNPNAD